MGSRVRPGRASSLLAVIVRAAPRRLRLGQRTRSAVPTPGRMRRRGSSAPAGVAVAQQGPAPLSPTAAPAAGPEAARHRGRSGFLPYWSLEGAGQTIDTDLVDRPWLPASRPTATAASSARSRWRRAGGVGCVRRRLRSSSRRASRRPASRWSLVVQRLAGRRARPSAPVRCWVRDGHGRLASQHRRPRRRTGSRRREPRRRACTRSGSPSDYVALVRRCGPRSTRSTRARPHARGPSQPRGYDLAGLTGEGAADLAVIMGYEYRGGTRPPGSQAPLPTSPSGAWRPRWTRHSPRWHPATSCSSRCPGTGVAWSAAPPSRVPPRQRRRRRRPGLPHYADAVPLAAQWGRRYDARPGLGLGRLSRSPLHQLRGDVAAALVRRPRQLRGQARPRSRERPCGRRYLGAGQEGGRPEMWSALASARSSRRSMTHHPPARRPSSRER